jgi:hypothetical protein
MAFVTYNDLKPNIRTNRLDQIIDSDDSVVTMASDDADAMLIDALHEYFDTDAIFAETGDARARNVLQWGKYITLYKIYERVPDEMVPERVVKNYNDTLDILKRISSGKFAVNLPRRNNECGFPKTKFRFGTGPEKRGFLK